MGLGNDFRNFSAGEPAQCECSRMRNRGVEAANFLESIRRGDGAFGNAGNWGFGDFGGG